LDNPNRNLGAQKLKAGSVKNENGKTLIEHLEICESFRERNQGLLGRDGLPRGHGMLISPCSSIHTFAMRFHIDCFFLDKEDRVLAIKPDLPPGRMAFGPLKTRSTLEIAAGWLKDDDAPHPGDRLDISVTG